LRAGRRDASCLIESYHPGSSIGKVESVLLNRTTYIGPVAADAGAAVHARPDDAFFVDVRARVDAYIASQHSHRYAYEFLGLAEAVITFLLYSYACFSVAVYGSWFWTIALGMLTGRMGFLMHLGNHCAVGRKPLHNRLIGWFMDLAGSNATIWGYEHQVAHHVEPNEFHKDYDCEIGNPTIRMHPEIPFAPTQKYQHILIPIAMTIGFFKWSVWIAQRRAINLQARVDAWEKRE